MSSNFLSKVLSVGENRPLRKYQKIADSVLALDDAYSDLEEAEFAEETAELRKRYQDGEKLEWLLPEAFALLREAASRVLGQRPYSVQVLGAVALFYGNVAQMKTGEGKTLVATMPAYLASLSGEPVHIVTVNEYLAEYQSELMGRVFKLLGVSTGVIVSGQSDIQKQENYACDIVYGTSSELGFDYLRDHMVSSAEAKTQRGLHYAIIDEIDSILMDEALTPLIIASPGDQDSMRELAKMAQAVRSLRDNEDYVANAKQMTVSIKDSGVEKVERAFNLTNIFESQHARLVGLMYSAVKAKALYKRDKDYIVRSGVVEIVDRETGRVLEGRRFAEGIHQAIEAKEGIKAQPEDVTSASVSIQNFFRLYDKLSGMTGTAKSESGELMELYKLHTVEIPTNKPMIREDLPTRYFVNEQAKWNAVVAEITERHATGQPVLVGTGTVAKSERLSRMLSKARLAHEVLNAKDDSREAFIVAGAGRKGAITVSTNMAGRGTDIILGGNPETLTVEHLKRMKIDPEASPEEYQATWNEVYAEYVQSCKASGEEVAELGGLFVLGTERHESRRVDDQLRGRAGRQGDPGQSQFFCSLDDELIVKYQPKGKSALASGMSQEAGELDPVKANKLFDATQAEASQLNRSIRTDVQKYDNVVDNARRYIYGERDRILTADTDFLPIVDEMRVKVVERYLQEHLSPNVLDWDIESLWSELASLYPSTITAGDVQEEIDESGVKDPEWVKYEVLSDSSIVLQRVHESLGSENFNEAARDIMLAALDEHWVDYIASMEMVLDTINYRAMAQIEPLNEYRREANVNIEIMRKAIEEDLVRAVMYLDGSNYSLRNSSSSYQVVSFDRKKKGATPKRKRNNSHVNSRVAFEAGLAEPFEFDDDGYTPMNRAERRAANKRKKRR